MKQLDDYENKLNIYKRDLDLKDKLLELRSSFTSEELERIITELGFDEEE